MCTHIAWDMLTECLSFCPTGITSSEQSEHTEAQTVKASQAPACRASSGTVRVRFALVVFMAVPLGFGFIFGQRYFSKGIGIGTRKG